MRPLQFTPELVAGLLSTLREAWRRDGAEGESVHALCDFVEHLGAEKDTAGEGCLKQSDEWQAMAGAQALEAATQKARAEKAEARLAAWLPVMRQVARYYHHDNDIWRAWDALPIEHRPEPAKEAWLERLHAAEDAATDKKP